MRLFFGKKESFQSPPFTTSAGLQAKSMTVLYLAVLKQGMYMDNSLTI